MDGPKSKSVGFGHIFLIKGVLIDAHHSKYALPKKNGEMSVLPV
jgi:hypothetical protein